MDPSSDHHKYCVGDFKPKDVVISGISGRFPECRNVGELKKAIYEKENLLVPSVERYTKGVYKNCELPIGVIPDIDKFDSDFFCMTRVSANGLESSTRVNLEVSYEAIVDSGYNPDDMRGLKVAVYSGVTSDDSLTIKFLNSEEFSIHQGRCMIANRTSFALDLIGPSHVIDSTCASSIVALQSAYHDLKNGSVDAAIVSGVQLNLNPEKQYQFVKAGVVSPDGNAIPFDATTNGMVRGESVVALFLQRAESARRVYASVASMEHYYSPTSSLDLCYYPFDMQVKIGQGLLSKSGITPDDVEYVEANCTGIAEDDKVELNAVAEVYLRHRTRKDPFYIGTIKSHIGHTESASGVCGVVNSILAFESGLICPNKQYKTPNKDCEELVNGKLIVPMEPTPLTKPYIAINAYGIGGVMTGTLLKRNPIESREKKNGKNLPRLILFPAVTEEGITHVFDYVKENYENLQDEFYALLNKLPYTPPFYKAFRGYSFMKDPQNPVTQIKNVSPNKREIWFIITGMGCQWQGMGLQLMEIDVFANSMRKSAAVLKKVGIDLFELLRADKNYLHVHRRILPAFVTITSIQIAMVDLINHLGIKPDGIVGHSTGEIVCAYADGCCTAEQSVMSAYYRGKAVEDLETSLVAGGMAAVGLSWEEALEKCPEGIFPVCDNAGDSVTISGLKEPLEQFVAQLQSENIFARVVDAYGYGFHCIYVHPVAVPLKGYLDELLKNPQPRTERWLSSSYPEQEWDLPESKLADSNYFTHNLMNPVRFYSVVKKIPKDAITIEFGPHFLLQSLLKRAIGPEAAYIGLMKRKEEDNVKFLFESLGKLYTEGADPKIERLYPPVEFPVPRGTPFLSDLVQWNHSVSFPIPKYKARDSPQLMEIDINNADAYMLDYSINGRHVFPLTGCILLAWETLAARKLTSIQQFPIMIENLKLDKFAVLTGKATTRLYCNLVEGTGYFEIYEGETVIASGNATESRHMTFSETAPTYKSDPDSSVSGKDLYTELKVNGYECGPEFQSLLEMNLEGTNGLVKWKDNWIPFLDALLVCSILENSEDFALPTKLVSVKIDPLAFQKYLDDHQDDEPKDSVPVSYNFATKMVRIPGVEIQGTTPDPAVQRRTEENPTTQLYKWIPYDSSYNPDKQELRCLNNYIEACNLVVNDVKKGLGKNLPQRKFPTIEVEKRVVDEFLSDTKSDRILLKILSDMSKNANNISAKKGEWLSLYHEGIGKDYLNNVMVNEESLGIMTQLIAENTFKKLSLLEVNNAFPLISTFLLESTNKFRQASLASTNTSQVDEELLTKHKIQLLPLQDISDLPSKEKQDVIISSFTTGTTGELEKMISSLCSALKPNGFILLFLKGQLFPAEKFLFQTCGVDVQVQSQSVLEKILLSRDLVILSKITGPNGAALYLIRPSARKDLVDKVVTVSEKDYKWVEEIKNELYVRGDTERLWIVSNNNSTSGHVGMVNCLKQEPKGDRVRCVLTSKGSTLPAFGFEQSAYKTLRTRNLVMNIWQDGAWGSYRHINIKECKRPKQCSNSCVTLTKCGDLSSFEWVESPLKYQEADGRNIVHIYYSGVNYKDVTLATGTISESSEKSDGVKDNTFGIEFSGRDQNGRRVCGFVRNGCMATSAVVKPHLMFEIPDHWTMEEAATVPAAFGTALYALIQRVELGKGESILIHQGTSDIGLAAICIAVNMGCEIYTTVSSDKERDYLLRNFPQIQPENIGDCRDLTFERMVMMRTKGRGVDCVMNSLPGDRSRASFRCVVTGGQFVELNRHNLHMDDRIGTKVFLEDLSYHGVFMDVLLRSDPINDTVMKEIVNLLKDGIKKGSVRPLDRKVFERDDVSSAFRSVAKETHIGKVLLKVRDEESSKVAIPKPLVQEAVPETYFFGNKVYIVIGGLGGFGIEVAKWIIERGGKHVILTSRNGARTPYHLLCLQRWKKDGVDVRVSTLNVGSRDQAEKLLKEASSIGPIGGIFNSATVLKDAFMDSQTPEFFKEVCESKASATKHLDELTRKMSPKLDYFVCFSCMSCGRGNAGQANYAFANSVMERICEERQKDGHHGLAVQWGIIGQVGMVHRRMGDDAEVAGVVAQRVKSCIAALDAFLQQDEPVVSCYTTSSRKKAAAKSDTFSKIAKVFGESDISKVDSGRLFSDPGLSQTAASEIKQLVESCCDVTLSLNEIRNMKVGDVTELLKKAESERMSSASSKPAVVRIPAPLMRTKPLEVLNKSPKGTPTFILHIGDTDLEMLTLFAKTLARPTFALRWTKDTPTTSINLAASHFLHVIRTVATGAFNLISIGISENVAREMAHQSEKSDKRMKSLTILYRSGDFVGDRSHSKDPNVRTLCQFVEQFASGRSSGLEEDLVKQTELEQQINTVVDFVASLSKGAINRSEVSAAVADFIRKKNLAKSYIAGGKISGDLHLFEDPGKVLPKDVAEAYKAAVSGKVEVHRVCTYQQLSDIEEVNSVVEIMNSYM